MLPLMISDKATGRVLRTYRNMRSLTVEELADKTGITKSIIKKIENGTRKLRFSEACQFCDYFRVTLDEFRNKSVAYDLDIKRSASRC